MRRGQGLCECRGSERVGMGRGERMGGWHGGMAIGSDRLCGGGEGG